MGRGGSTHILLERDTWELLPRGRNREDSHCSDVVVVFWDIGWSSPVRSVMEPGIWSSLCPEKIPWEDLRQGGSTKTGFWDLYYSAGVSALSRAGFLCEQDSCPGQEELEVSGLAGLCKKAALPESCSHRQSHLWHTLRGHHARDPKTLEDRLSIIHIFKTRKCASSRLGSAKLLTTKKPVKSHV